MGICDAPNVLVSHGIIFSFYGNLFFCAAGVHELIRIRTPATKEQEWL